MYADVYIGLVKSEKFDYDLPGNNICYIPTRAFPKLEDEEPKYHWGERELYWSLWGHPKGKQVEWGCYVIKMTASEIVDFFQQEKYKDNVYANFLAERVAECLNPSESYLITCVET